MSVPSPHFVLVSESEPDARKPCWRFKLAPTGGGPALVAAGAEPEVRGERLELLAVVRGLEALDQPSRVTLFTSSRYVNRGISFGLDEWRRNGWTWECFGQMTPIKNRDLWQRLDRALSFHRIDFKHRRIDPPHPVTVASATPVARTPASESGGLDRGWRRLGSGWRNCWRSIKVAIGSAWAGLEVPAFRSAP